MFWWMSFCHFSCGSGDQQLAPVKRRSVLFVPLQRKHSLRRGKISIASIVTLSSYFSLWL
jgi:hypothetical protein